jgi:stage II sporulation SpoE-like protein
VLLIQTAMNYRYVSDNLIRQEALRVAEDTVRIVERAARMGRLESVQSAASLLEEVRSERADYLAWMVLRQGDGAVTASAGDAGSPRPRRPGRRGSADQGLDREQSSTGRDLLVGGFPCRCGIGERTTGPGAGRGGPAPAAIEIALYGDGLSAPFARLRRDALVSTAAALTLLVSLVLIARRFGAYVRGKQLEAQINLARRVQQDLLPRSSSPPPGVDVAAECLSAARVGGDFFDIVSLPGQRYAFLVGDVSGHGISAALLMGLIHGAMSSPHWGVADDEASRAAELNHLLVTKSSVERFASLFWCAFDPAAARLRYINAGHPPPLWIRRRDHVPAAVDRLTVGGPVLGVLEAARYAVEEVPAAPGDVLVLFSDGVVEATNDAGEFFGDDRLVGVVRQSAEAPPRAMVDAILSAVRTFTGGRRAEDDQTLLIVRLPAPGLRTTDPH